MTITGSNTTNFGIQKLGSNDSAGYSTINEVVDGIDTILNASDRLIKAAQTPTVAYVITGDGTDWVRGLVVTASITDLNVTTGKLADLSVTTAKINDLSVTTGKLADLSVTTGKINDLAVTTGKITDLNVTTGKINDLAVTTGKIAGDAVTLGTKTTGDYVATITGTANEIASSAATSGEGTAHTLSLVSSAILPGAPTVATAVGSYPQSGTTARVSTVQYVNDAVANVNASGSVALSGDVGGTAGATVIGVSKVTSSMILDNTIVLGDLATALQAFLVPTGTVSAYAGSTAPPGYLLCDGTAGYSTTTYAALFTAIGYTYGGSGGSFTVPDLKGRTIIGVGVGTEITGVLGTVQGVKEVTLTAAQSGTTAHTHPNGTTSGHSVDHNHTFSGTTGNDSPDHSHGYDQALNTGFRHANDTTQIAYFHTYTAVSTGGASVRHQHPFSGTTNGVSADHTHTYTISAATAAAAVSAHTNIQPSLPLNYIIKV